jgi:NarL family two-component system sensor histidine kinase LiaS
MVSVRTRFGGLYWRLAGSYFAVTLLAAVIIEIAITLPASMQGYQQVSATPYGKTPIPTSPARSGIAHISLFLSIFWDHLQDNGLYLILLAGVVGTLTGLLITRNVTRRLRRITQAADAWSKGEFAVEVRDPTRDEIGQLGQDLNGMAEQLHTLLATREELATIEERNRLARDLHDSIKQNVFATALLVGAARSHLPPDTLPAQTYLAEAEALAEQTRQELTALIRELRPARLADKGLAVVLRDYAEDWSRRMGIAIAMTIQGERVIALDIEEALLRVGQEALANIAQHSGAAHVTIYLIWDDARVRLTITDDGNGFDVAHANGRGVGLASMRERVAAHSGTLQIASTAGAATVEATIPLHSAEKANQEETP